MKTRPISRSQLAAIVNEGAPDDGLVDVRDTALILVAFWGRLRRSEVVALDVGDVQEAMERGRDYRLDFSRHDNDPPRAPVDFDGLSRAHWDICPVINLENWLEERAMLAHATLRAPLFVTLGSKTGRMTERQAQRAFDRCVRAAGFDLRRVRFHGLRLGGLKEARQ